LRTKAVRTQASDPRGEYVFVALLPDAYRVGVELAGFAPWRSGEVRLSPGDSLHLDTALTVGERSEEVTVAAERQLVRTDTGARDNTISADQIQNLSIISRGAMELLRILPGVVSDQQSMEAIGFNFGGANSLINYSVNGQRGTQMSPVLDGSKIVDFGSNGGVMANINPEMVDEVKVQTSNYAAEYGSSTVQITAVTKGGSPAFHGSVYDYWRTWRLAANDRSNN
jgi:outer membrane receptor protein involved in Fe transport